MGGGIATSKKTCPCAGDTLAFLFDKRVEKGEVVDLPRVLAGIYTRTCAALVAPFVPWGDEADLQYTFRRDSRVVVMVRTNRARGRVAQVVRAALAAADLTSTCSTQVVGNLPSPPPPPPPLFCRGEDMQEPEKGILHMWPTVRLFQVVFVLLPAWVPSADTPGTPPFLY